MTRNGSKASVTDDRESLRAIPPTGQGAVGAVLRRARQRRGWSIREVERRTGLSNTWLSQVERGIIQKPDPTALWRLASILGLDFTLLLEWSTGNDTEGASSPVAAAALRVFLALPDEDKVRALDFIQQLAADVPRDESEPLGDETLIGQ